MMMLMDGVVLTIGNSTGLEEESLIHYRKVCSLLLPTKKFTV